LPYGALGPVEVGRRQRYEELVVPSKEREVPSLGARVRGTFEPGGQGEEGFVHVHTDPTGLGEKTGGLGETIRRVEHGVRPSGERDPLGHAGTDLEEVGKDAGARPEAGT
jgi:hypothetical protein